MTLYWILTLQVDNSKYYTSSTTVASGDDRERFWRRLTGKLSLATFWRFFQLLTNFAIPYRSETIRNGFPMKFRIDIGPQRLKKHFPERKSMKNRAKSPTSTPGARHPPATYYGSSHWIFFWDFWKKIREKKSFFRTWNKNLKIWSIIFIYRF